VVERPRLMREICLSGEMCRCQIGERRTGQARRQSANAVISSVTESVGVDVCSSSRDFKTVLDAERRHHLADRY
jgi:hypothetical protein